MGKWKGEPYCLVHSESFLFKQKKSEVCQCLTVSPALMTEEALNVVHLNQRHQFTRVGIILTTFVLIAIFFKWIKQLLTNGHNKST